MGKLWKMEVKMINKDKQLKYSIRKFSIGVASVAIGAVFLQWAHT